MIESLLKKLNYEFQDIALLKMALTHRSTGHMHNERLEFLGDAVVNFIIAEALYDRYPAATEGELSRWRATLVNRETLTELARCFELGQFLYLGPGELKMGGSSRDSILSCTMEAIMGAIYLDAGYEKARAIILSWYQTLLHELAPASDHKDPKSQLQEYMQSLRLPLPLYTVERISGEAHKQRFIVMCQVENYTQAATGEGTSRRRAEQAAAQAMLNLLFKT